MNVDQPDDVIGIGDLAAAVNGQGPAGSGGLVLRARFPEPVVVRHEVFALLARAPGGSGGSSRGGPGGGARAAGPGAG